MSYVKLDCGILTSTLWILRDCREVFITALLMAEPFESMVPLEQIEVDSLTPTGFIAPPGWYGLVPAAGIGIIGRAGLEPGPGMCALRTLGSPDPESRSLDFDGRRMVRVDGGYLILNYMKYRERDHSTAERSKRYRAKRKFDQESSRRDDTPSRRDDTCQSRDITEAEAEAEVHKTTTTKTRTRVQKKTLEKLGLAYGPEVVDLTNRILNRWPIAQPNGDKIQLDPALTAERLDGLMQNPEVTADLLFASADVYLSEPKKWFKAAQYFFGKAESNEGANWRAYARVIYTKQVKGQVNP